MAERMQQFSHTVVRVVAVITLTNLGITAACEGYFSTHCHALANSPFGQFMTFWTIATSSLLPLYVAFEFWWMRRNKVAMAALWVDAALAIACFLGYVGIVRYAFGHYAMF
jgi:hypothetical protein